MLPTVDRQEGSPPFCAASWTRGLGLAVALLAACPSGARAQAAEQLAHSEPLLVLVVDAGDARVNTRAVSRTVGRALSRVIIRMTDERAPEASGRLMIAHSPPDRWVLRYESAGEVAWTSARVPRPGTLLRRLAALSRTVVRRLEHAGESERDATWRDSLILALQNELIDPFEDDPPAPRAQDDSLTLVWSEVVDPFEPHARRAEIDGVWSEVLDPWDQAAGAPHTATEGGEARRRARPPRPREAR